MDLKALVMQYVLVPALVGIGGIAAALVHALFTWVQAKAKNQKLANAIGVVDHLAENIVADLNASMKPQLAVLGEGGVLDAAGKAKLKSTAVASLKASLATNAAKAAEDLLAIVSPSLESYLSGAIEKAVLKLSPK